jgi:lysophospholipid acyltransferase (LPLAT)-like uncharacterized protein
MVRPFLSLFFESRSINPDNWTILQVKCSMHARIKPLLTHPCVTGLLYWIVHSYSRAFRLTVENEAAWLAYLKGGGKVLLCGWHQQFFAIIRHCESYRPYHPSIMISQSQDGEMIAGVAAKSGWFPVRGSSSRGGSQALKLLVERLKETGLAAHIVDGPRGPAGKLKRGAIYLAQATGAAIVPMYVSADKAWFFNSWDKFLLPKPFTRVTLRFGDMINLSATENPEELERQRKYIEDVMLPGLIR